MIFDEKHTFMLCWALNTTLTIFVLYYHVLKNEKKAWWHCVHKYKLGICVKIGWYRMSDEKTVLYWRWNGNEVIIEFGCACMEMRTIESSGI